MGIRIAEGGIAVGFGAADALVTAKITTKGPGNIPWPVYLEGAGIAAGFFGEKVGLPVEVRDTVMVSALALAGARLTRVAMAGNLAKGPSAWGGDYNLPAAAASGAGGGGNTPLLGGGRRNIRALPGVGGVSTWDAGAFEQPGVAG
jgi:hypothetical protein